jgi:mycothiol system anti-sigma-R factor
VNAMDSGAYAEDDVAHCGEVLRRVYELLDGEMSPDDVRRLKRHLDDCGPCLAEYNLDVMLKALLRRSCACEEAPVSLRQRIMVQITEVRIQSGN